MPSFQAPDDSLSEPRKFHPARWVIVLVLFAGLLNQVRLAHLVYGVVRSHQIRAAEHRLRGQSQLTSLHFHVYYPKGESTSARLVDRIAEGALPVEEHSLDVKPTHKLVVVIYPNQAKLNQSVNMAVSDNDIGFDWDGIMDVLSPAGWMGTSAKAFEQYREIGPVTHELGHALLNLKADGNYPNWFNEGVAQYEDEKLTGYVWITPHNALSGSLYSMTQLSQNFYQLPHQGRAYRQGLSLVNYMIHLHGPSTFHRFLDQLAGNATFNQALSSVYHFTPNTLYSSWYAAGR